MRTITRVITNRLLKLLPVPDRDRSWSQHTYHALHDGSPLGRLIRWAAREGSRLWPAAAPTDRRPADAHPPSPVQGVVSGHRLVQARWRPEGLDGLGAHAHRPPRHGTTERLRFCRNPNG